MIRPDLGTMIAILTTDAEIAAHQLQPLLGAAAARSFNRITVDGSQSTSDSVIVLASGASGVTITEANCAAFSEALFGVCHDLALEIVADGEGARRIGRYEVVGARTAADADRAARHVAEDQLVRCALYGADPNWGRIVAALGVCGVDLDTDRISIDLGGVPLVRDGIAVAGAAAAAGEAARGAAGRRPHRSRGPAGDPPSSTDPTCRPSTSSTTRSTPPDAARRRQAGRKRPRLPARRPRARRRRPAARDRPRRRRADLRADAPPRHRAALRRRPPVHRPAVAGVRAQGARPTCPTSWSPRSPPPAPAPCRCGSARRWSASACPSSAWSAASRTSSRHRCRRPGRRAACR